LLEGSGQACTNARRQSEPLGQAFRHLALSANSFPGSPSPTAHHPGHQPGPANGSISSADLGYDLGGELARLSSEDRRDGRAQGDLVAPDHLRHLVGVGGAAEKAEKRDVVDIAEILATQT
jgi:hypothetical protein